MTTTLTRPATTGLGADLRGRRLPTWGPPVLWTLAAVTALAGFLTPLGAVRGILLAWCVAAIVPVWSTVVEGRRKATDRLVTHLVASAFVLALIPLVSILITVVGKGTSALSAEFFSYSMRNVVGEGGGIYHGIIGTLLITGAAAVISVPIGLFTAIYLIEYGNDSRLASAIRFLVDVMTGIPSIVAGLFAYSLFVLFFGEGVRLGIGGSVALSVLMIPVVVRSCEEMLKLVPNELREASYALGVPKWRTVVKVVLPTALAGIVTGITLAIARVIGETAPLLIIAGMTDSVNFNLFDGRMQTLPVFTYSALMNPGVPAEPSIERAWGAALVLLLIVMALNLVARLVSHFFSPQGER
ncbi:phosphate ABC transporter permease PstA [Aeromicrobium sp. 636]|uniref:Phosphate transport system permease protein PstA n=1 Tax=Aeromicrobium senzhongii TaxID=2663859 RepID=A0A8I0EXG9_9ACTN|nr:MULTISPECIES: phosphate ABC transporter permease PstA [Aeromicrobium]MBC9227201.1 phosphate ABC transporter permease PstA [Aeromicrobium senzhongii]MCQ3999300.1 phosphate ABC transporter permease PstA [Aeromicrobium sp. 636]MTB88388.1 phosphate ABC transporter permease PstA [Aeromicrobium senzhongii]QNL94641.1 phosphate ABC transporter permease PstA [Aeromicrobium senzhongii]